MNALAVFDVVAGMNSCDVTELDAQVVTCD